MLTESKTELAKLEQKETPFAGGVPEPGRWSKRKQGEERWVRPTLVAEVEFAEWTPEGHVRHASFISLRGQDGKRNRPRNRDYRELNRSVSNGSPRPEAVDRRSDIARL